ncbi:uncharacterized protein [Typha angustifolia]|uniref:uncharacterized protein isoform X2 n=1 Tax=Typha angustifolia TaxID=59011 RepID=UPI003C30AEC4
MACMKKWMVTYTKHMKQKRKVYQDGVLELNVSGDKVMLYNDSEKLIDSKFLRKDEVIECGGTVALEIHLVDIGNSIEDQKPLKNLNISDRDKKLNGSSGTQGDEGNNNRKLQREPLLTDSNVTWRSIGKSKRGAFSGGQLQNRSSINSSHMNKKTGAVESSTPETHPNSIHTTLKEWNVLYTNQLTQKAKKYHDGILRLVQCGLRMKQIILLNEDGAVLSSKYLKSVDGVESGIKYELPNYLLEIYEPRVLQEEVLQKNPSKQVLRSDISRKSKLVDPQKGHLEQAISSSSTVIGKSTRSRSDNPLSDEWNVLYTTQLTQKAKKYHDGILQLAQCGSHTKQIILLDEDGTTLSSRYLKSVEDVKSGIKCELPNYLVEICEPRILLEEILHKSALEQASRSDIPRKNKFPSNEGDQPKGQLEQTTSSSSTNVVNSTSSRSDNPLRDACQILSVLKKRLPEAKCDIRELPLTQDQPSLSSDIILLDVESRSNTDISLSRMNPLGKIVSDSNTYGPIGGASQVYTSGSSSRKAETSSTFFGSDIIGPIGTEHEGRFPTHDHSISNNLFSGQVAAESSVTKLDKCMDQISVGTTTSCTGFKMSDANTGASSRMSQEIALEKIDYGIPLSGRPSIYMDVELPLRELAASPLSKRSEHLADSLSNHLEENCSAAGNGSCPFGMGTHISISHECKYENPEQILADTKEERCDIQSSDASAITDMISNNSDFQSSSSKCTFIDEHPTFDLGF